MKNKKRTKRTKKMRTKKMRTKKMREYFKIAYNFWKETKLYPLFRKHYKVVYYDWYYKQVLEGWYIKDKNGYPIPWIHNYKGGIICYGPWDKNVYYSEGYNGRKF